MNLIWILISYLWSFLIFIFLTKPTEKTLSLYLYISQFIDLHCKLELIWILYMLPVPRSAYTFLRMPSETVMSLNQSILKYLSFFFRFCFFKQELLACLKAFCKSVAVFSLLIKKKKRVSASSLNMNDHLCHVRFSLGVCQHFQKVIPHQFDSCPDKLILRAYQVKYNPKRMKK